MTDVNDNTTARKPEYLAYNVQESRDGKGHWSQVGAAWAHRDGQGYDIQLSSVPVNGRVILRELREERMQDYEDQRQQQTIEQEQRNSPSRGRGRAR